MQASPTPSTETCRPAFIDMTWRRRNSKGASRQFQPRRNDAIPEASYFVVKRTGVMKHMGLGGRTLQETAKLVQCRGLYSNALRTRNGTAMIAEVATCEAGLTSYVTKSCTVRGQLTCSFGWTWWRVRRPVVPDGNNQGTMRPNAFCVLLRPVLKEFWSQVERKHALRG